jgi:hypothetical protein
LDKRKLELSIKRKLKSYLLDLEYRAHLARLRRRNRQFSNFNEEAIIRQYISELFPKHHSRTAVDIGASDGVRRSNSYRLFTEGWSGLSVEYDHRTVCKLARAYRHYPEVYVCRCRITSENVVPLLDAYGIEREFGLLSLDIDGNDYWVLEAILKQYRPQLIVSEINEKIPPPIRFVVRYNPDFTLRHHFYGYSIAMLEDLTTRYNYSILQLEYNNIFLAPSEIARGRGKDAATTYREGYLDRSDRLEKLADNHDMEILHSLSPEEGIKFLKNFYSKFEGEYEIEAGELVRT